MAYCDVFVVRGVSTCSTVSDAVGAAEEREADRRARRDAERVGGNREWCLTDELAPGGQSARPGRDAELEKNAATPR